MIGRDLLTTGGGVGGCEWKIFPSLAPSDAKSRGGFFLGEDWPPNLPSLEGDFHFSGGNPAARALSANAGRITRKSYLALVFKPGGKSLWVG